MVGRDSVEPIPPFDVECFPFLTPGRNECRNEHWKLEIFHIPPFAFFRPPAL